MSNSGKPFKSDLPSKVNLLEEGRINLGITYLSQGQTFAPDPRAKYVWILTEDNQVIIGVEDPFTENNRAAFDKTGQALLKEYQKTLEKDLTTSLVQRDLKLSTEEIDTTVKIKRYLGHTTLTSKFDAKGNPMPERAPIAGELFYYKKPATNKADRPKNEDNKPEAKIEEETKEEGWYLNNVSGRYYKVLGNDKATITELLTRVKVEMEAKLIFQDQKGNKIPVQLKLEISTKKEKTIPSEIWKKSHKFKKPGQELWTPAEHGVHMINKIFKYNFGKESARYKMVSKKIKEHGNSMTDLIDYCTAKSDELCGNNSDMKKDLQEFVKFLMDKNQNLPQEPKNDADFSAASDIDSSAVPSIRAKR